MDCLSRTDASQGPESVTVSLHRIYALNVVTMIVKAHMGWLLRQWSGQMSAATIQVRKGFRRTCASYY